MWLTNEPAPHAGKLLVQDAATAILDTGLIVQTLSLQLCRMQLPLSFGLGTGQMAVQRG